MTLLRVNEGRATLTLPTGECSICKQPFIKRSTLHSICSVRCLNTVKVLESKRQRAERRETKKKLDDLKPRGYWLAQCQKDFNAYIRARDAALSCVACGRMHTGQWHASHYRSVGSSPALRFDEANVHSSCAPCNSHLHGNLIPYRVELIKRIGAAEVDRLEGPQPAAMKYTSNELKAMAADYRARTRMLMKERE